MSRVAGTAVVIGAGMGGLAAAAALSPRAERVIVLDRDRLPSRPDNRPSVPQGRHVHGLLAGGYRALEALLPGFSSRLTAAGALRLRVMSDLLQERPGYDPFPARDLGFDSINATRPLLEHCTRELVRELPNVAIEMEHHVDGLAIDRHTATVTGVRYHNAGGSNLNLPADLTIDASGRGMPTLEALKELGRQPPPIDEVGVDIAYSSTFYRIPKDASADWKAIMTFGQAPNNPTGGLLMAVEDDCWHLGVAGRPGSQPPGDPEGFLEFVRCLRTDSIYLAVRHAERITDIKRFGFSESRWCHFEKVADFPRGLLPLGDAIARFNPVYGQGMSVAAQQAVALGETIDAADGDIAAPLAAAYLTSTANLVQSPWNMSVLPDFAFPATRGERPADLPQRLEWSAALLSLGAEDAEVHRIMTEVGHLIRSPSSLFEPTLLARVQARIQERRSASASSARA